MANGPDSFYEEVNKHKLGEASYMGTFSKWNGEDIQNEIILQINFIVKRRRNTIIIYERVSLAKPTIGSKYFNCISAESFLKSIASTK